MYTEILDDPKVQLLPGELFKTWVNILAVASKYGGEIPIEQLSQHLSHRSDRNYRDISELINRGLLTYGGGLIIPHNWFGRQYRSDFSTSRTRRFKSKMKRSRNEKKGNEGTAPEKKVSKKERETAKKWVAEKEARLTSEPQPTNVTPFRNLKPLGEWKD